MVSTWHANFARLEEDLLPWRVGGLYRLTLRGCHLCLALIIFKLLNQENLLILGLVHTTCITYHQAQPANALLPHYGGIQLKPRREATFPYSPKALWKVSRTCIPHQRNVKWEDAFYLCLCLNLVRQTSLTFQPMPCRTHWNVKESM